METRTQPSAGGIDETAALRSIVEGTATETGERFFASLVENLAKALGTHGAWVTEYLEEPRRLRALAFWLGGQWVRDYEHVIDGTPCQAVIEGRRLVHYPDKILEIYPEEPDLRSIGAVSYMGVPLLDVDGKILGHLAVLDTQPMPAEPRALALFQIFANRAAAELRRLRAEAEVREREEKLSGLVDSALDAIIEIDGNFHATRVNPAAVRVFGCQVSQLVGQPFTRWLSTESATRLTKLKAELDTRPRGSDTSGFLAALPLGGQMGRNSLRRPPSPASR
jgi:PAS domain-containing protein